MRLRSLRLFGIGPAFPAEVSLDIEALPGDLIAVTGPNGAGKSTLLESAYAALHPSRKCPTRGSIDALADGQSKEAFVEVDYDCDGKNLKIRHEPNVGQSFVWLDGEAQNRDGKVSKFAEWSRSNLPAPEVVNAALFLSQKSEGAIDADGAERRAILLRAIGVDAIEAKAEQARRLAREAEKGLLELRADAQRLRALPTVEAAQARQQEAARALAVAEQSRAVAEDSIRAARSMLDAYQARERERHDATLQREASAVRLGATRAKVEDLQARLTAQRAMVTEAEEIRANATRCRALEVEIAEWTKLADSAHATATLRASEEEHALQAWEASRARWRAASDRRRGLGRLLADRDKIESSVAALPVHRASVLAQAEDVARREAEIEQIATHLTTTRIDGLTDALMLVEHTTRLDEAHEIAHDALEADKGSTKRAEDIPSLRAALDRARFNLRTAEQVLQANEQLASRAEDLRATIEADRLAADEMAAAEAEGTAHKELASTLRQAAQMARDGEEDARTRANSLSAARDALLPFLVLESDMAGAEVRAAEIATQLDEARQDHEAAQRAHDALPEPPEPLPKPDQAAADGALADASRAVAEATVALTLADRDLDTAHANATKLAEIEAALAPQEERLADLTLLAEVLGISGVQALEIDAAGPALTANMNELLHTSYGARYSCEVSATRKSKDGKKDIDECEILVLDTKHGGKKRDVRTFSGGERVPLSTAFFLSLAIYLCRSRGLHAPSLVLDEPGAGLDEEHASPWLDMLRKASRMAGASKTIVITHDQRAIDAADTVVEVRDGGVNVVR